MTGGDHQHERVVFSMALAERWIMVQCAKCGTVTVKGPGSGSFYVARKREPSLRNKNISVTRFTDVAPTAPGSSASS